MLQYFETLTDDSGNSLLGATCTVTNYPSGSLASIYNTNGTASPVANSTVVADITGQISFYAPDGAYTLTYSYKSTVYKTKTPVQMQDPMGSVLATDTGAANAYVVTNASFPASLYVGLRSTFIPSHTNGTGASTYNLNATGAQPLVQADGSNPPAGLLVAGGVVQVIWTGAAWQVLSIFLNAAAIAAVIYPQTQAEINAGVTPTNFDFATQPYDIRRYGAKLDAVTDDTAAWNTALLVASQTVNTADGSAIFVPLGVSVVSSMILLPNRVRVIGMNKRGSIVRAAVSWTVGNGVGAWNSGTAYVTGNFVTNGGVLYVAKQGNTNQAPPNATYWNPISNAMFYAQNGYTAGVGNSMFDSTLENLTVDANNVASLGCALSSAWQEGCGLRAVLLYQFATYGVRFQDGFGGAALSKVVDSEIFSGTTANTLGIDLTSAIGAAAAFMLDVSNTTVAGGAQLTAGISAKGNSVCARSVHFENCTSAVLADGLGYITIDDITGVATDTSLVQLAATFNGDLVYKNGRRLGATNFLNDLRAGGYGAIVSDHPLLIINANDSTSVAKGGAFASAWCVFNGFTAGTNAPAAGFNVTSVTRNGVGNYTVTMLRPMLSANGAAIATTNLATGQVSTVLSSATTFTVVVEVAGVATDSAEIKVIAFGG